MLHGQFFVDATGDPNIRVQMFQKVHEISPNTLTFVNDYSILMWEVNEYVSGTCYKRRPRKTKYN